MNMNPIRVCTLHPEFLKGATMRPHGRAKFFRDRARFGFLNAKMHNLPLFYLFWVIFWKICLFLAHFVCAKLSDRNIGRAKKITFRKSGHMSYVTCHMSSHILFYLFKVIFRKICLFLAHFVCAKLSNRNIGRAKKIAFRKSQSIWPIKNLQAW